MGRHAPIGPALAARLTPSSNGRAGIPHPSPPGGVSRVPRARSRRTFDETPPELRWPLGPLPTGLLLFAWAAVVALALSFPDGAVSGWMRGLLRGALGLAAYLAPLVLVGLGLAAWRPPFVPAKRLERHAIVSWLVLLTALAGLLHPLAGRPQPAGD